VAPQSSTVAGCLEPGGARVKIFDGFEEIEILPWHECEDCTSHLHFSSRLWAVFFLRRFKADFIAMASLRRVGWEIDYFRGCSISNDDEILEFVANKLVTGELHVTRKVRVYTAGPPRDAIQETQPEVKPEPAPPRDVEKVWFRARLRDEDGISMAGEDYVLVDSTGARTKGKLDANGEVYIPRILPPGDCTINFPNIHLNPRKRK
jgi:hypothetical protein